TTVAVGDTLGAHRCATAPSVRFYFCHSTPSCFLVHRCMQLVAISPSRKRWPVPGRSRTRERTTEQQNSIKQFFANSRRQLRRDWAWAETWQESAVARKRPTPLYPSPRLVKAKA